MVREVTNVTISGYQSFSFSAIRLNVTVTSQPGAALAAAAPGTEPVDRVTLSPEAAADPTATSEADETATGSTEEAAAASTPPVPPPSRAARRADALFAALDGDQDGALSADEFTSGALNLLRSAGARRRIEDDGDGDRRESRGLRRLERKLEKAFERVDANDDGAIDKNELTAALARTKGHHRRGSDGPPPPEAPATAAPAAGATTVSFSVTFVSIAVQRYSAVQSAAPASSEAADAPDAREKEAGATPARAA